VEDNSGKIHFLVIDDEEGVAHALCLLLQAIGHRATKCTVPEEAGMILASEDSKDIDLILCDLRMPKHDGFWVLEQRNRYCRAIPFVLMSAHAVTDDIEKALAQGANTFLPKPFDPDNIARLLEELELKGSDRPSRS